MFDRGYSDKLKDAIHEFLDIVERPVGPLKDFTVPKTEEADRKILALYDAIGRIP